MKRKLFLTVLVVALLGSFAITAYAEMASSSRHYCSGCNGNYAITFHRMCHTCGKHIYCEQYYCGYKYVFPHTCKPGDPGPLFY